MRAGAWILLGAAMACASRAAPPSVAPAPAPRAPEPADRLVGATVYDAAGAAMKCEAPRADCKTTESDAHFSDQCRLAGYQVRRCGCTERCSGNAAQANLHYDASGNAEPCAPAQPDCTPPDTSAAFQDACTDAHHRLEVCGCEWLCSGPPRP